MKTQPPTFSLIAQLGDVDPVTYGGYFVFEDTTGVYSPEIEVMEPIEDNNTVEVHRFPADICYLEGGILSYSKYHRDHPAWFADDLDAVADCMDTTADDIRSALCSHDIAKRAAAYQDLAGYFGVGEFDQYPLILTIEEAEQRVSEHAKTA